MPPKSPRRWIVLAAAQAMNLCLGATYAWSLFVGPLRAELGLSQGAAQWPFTVFYIAFPLTTIGAGALIRRFGQQACAAAGGLLFGSGWLLAGLGAGHFGFSVVGIGLLGGMGVGFAYLVPISACQQWFPRHKGLVTGFAVAGFGGGAMLITQAAQHLMADRGATPFEVFTTLGLAFAAIVTVAGLLMFPAPDGATSPAAAGAEPVDLPRPFPRDPVFVALYGAMLVGLVAGLSVNANLKQLGPVASEAAGLRAVQLFALTNAAGRILWGGLADRLAMRTVLRANLLAQAASVLAGPALLGRPAGLLIFAALAGLNYGGVLVLYATSVARRWGTRRVGQVYGALFSANLPAGFGPVLVGASYDVLGHFDYALAAIGLLLVASAVWVRAE